MYGTCWTASGIISTAGALNGLILPITLGVALIAFSEEICYGRRLSSSSIITGSWDRGSCCLVISWNYIIKQLMHYLHKQNCLDKQISLNIEAQTD